MLPCCNRQGPALHSKDLVEMHPKGERPKTVTGSTRKLCGVASSKQWTEHLCLRGRDEIRANHISILEGRLDNTAGGWSVCSNDCNADDNCCQRLAELGQCVLGLVCKCSNDYKAGDHPGCRNPAVLPQCRFGRASPCENDDHHFPKPKPTVLCQNLCLCHDNLGISNLSWDRRA